MKRWKGPEDTNSLLIDTSLRWRSSKGVPLLVRRLTPDSAVQTNKAQVDEEDEDEKEEHGLSPYCIYHLQQCPWQAYLDIIDDYEVPLGSKTRRQYEEGEDDMEQFLDMILCHANTRGNVWLAIPGHFVPLENDAVFALVQ